MSGIASHRIDDEGEPPPPSLSDRYRLGEATLAGMGGKEEDAPIPAVRMTTRLGPGGAHPGPGVVRC
jgi:hypothetical protein